ncbi:MAG: glycosyltransferase family 2 protein [Candidatus Woesearchaeota archaeon]
MVQKKSKVKAVVCLPTYNEKESISEMIKRMKKLKIPFFLSDQGSKDGTREIAKKNKVEVYDRGGYGKGWGVRKAVEVAKQKKYDVVVLIDCDCSYPPEYIPQLLKLMPRYDMVMGVRNFKDIGFLHRLGNFVHTGLINLLYNARLKDINTGLRAFKIKKLQDLGAEGFDIEAEITCKALKRGFKIKEIPIHYHVRKGESKIRLKDGWIILKRIIKEFFAK